MKYKVTDIREIWNESAFKKDYKQTLIVTTEGENTHPILFPTFRLKNKCICFSNNENMESILGNVFAFWNKYGGNVNTESIPSEKLYSQDFANCKVANDFYNEYGADVTANEILFAAYLIASLKVKVCPKETKETELICFVDSLMYEITGGSKDIMEIIRKFYIRFSNGIKPFGAESIIQNRQDYTFEEKLEVGKNIELYFSLFGNLSVAQLMKFANLKIR